jgi:hypothetical protein
MTLQVTRHEGAQRIYQKMMLPRVLKRRLRELPPDAAAFEFLGHLRVDQCDFSGLNPVGQKCSVGIRLQFESMLRFMLSDFDIRHIFSLNGPRR